MNNAKDLAIQAPRSPYELIDGFAILARTIDKCRAYIAGTTGEYHFDCPLDKVLFGFKGINSEEFKAFIGTGASDEEISKWLSGHGISKTPEEVKSWSDLFRSDFSYSTDPNKSEWFKGECEKLVLDYTKTTLFDYLEVDDKQCFSAK